MPTVSSWLDTAIELAECFAVSPSCIPQRAGFTTGRYPIHGGHRSSATKVRAGEPELISRFRTAGYETALIGVNHTADEAAIERMFCHRKAIPATPGVALDRDRPGSELYHGPVDVPATEFDQSRTTDAALDWMRGRGPFLLMLNWFLPHAPYRVPAGFHGRIPRDELEIPAARPPGQPRPAWERAAVLAQHGERRDRRWWRELVGTYVDSCYYLDREFARLLDFLDRTGITGDTVVLLWSDHGDFAGERRLVEKWPASFVDAITRIPAALSVPGVSAARVTGLVSAVDLVPTLLDVCGLDVPAGLNGRSLVPYFADPTTEIRPHVLCQAGWEPELAARLLAVAEGREGWKYRALEAAPAAMNRAVMLRTKRHKYIVRTGGTEELYDLAADPLELEDLAGTAGGLAADLRRDLIEAMLLGGDHLPVPELDRWRL